MWMWRSWRWSIDWDVEFVHKWAWMWNYARMASFDDWQSVPITIESSASANSRSKERTNNKHQQWVTARTSVTRKCCSNCCLLASDHSLDHSFIEEDRWSLMRRRFASNTPLISNRIIIILTAVAFSQQQSMRTQLEEIIEEEENDSTIIIVASSWFVAPSSNSPFRFCFKNLFSHSNRFFFFFFFARSISPPLRFLLPIDAWGVEVAINSEF